ncbi:DNA topoisomerase 2 [Boothiomyces macroporosus]|uniref:DNA topoisomerase 2 n=1 Tax=Boothiomyces macroporosus TaxID=261099 RepID=A0AAD5UEH7_9FUNG|nr:DNA topoisomerase 2 [Boothiomyces macroporosus]
MDTIKVSIDKENNVISVYNNGKGIPIKIHAKEQVYVPELIFGHLLTSSNYDDDEQKITGGRNGYGAKLCNIFSKQFIVETADSETKLKFKQVFSDNMSKRGEPKITNNNRGEDYTQITFKPDLAKFGLDSIDDDFAALLTKRVYDLAGCVRGVKVYLNDTRIKMKDFKEYMELYINSANDLPTKPPIVYERINDRWEVGFTLSDGQFNQVSFVNSICTIKGGTHVNSIADQLVTHLIEAVKKKDKKGVPLKPFQAKSHLWLFVNCSIVNPTFDSQTKETMTLKTSQFGSKGTLGEDFVKKVLKSGVVENILSFAKFKQDQLMKKTDGSGKKTRISGLSKLDDANNAGTRNAGQCTLILTEGDSAKSLAVSGLSVVGRDNFGVFPLRGKLLNVREASHAQIMANAEISAIKQILGLQQGKVYNDTNSLRYGHLMIMTDQDHDGSHIKGLIINFFDHFWPSLLKIPGFLLEFITPIVKATKGKGSQKKEISFFTIPEYEAWKEENDNGRGWTLKYYKGLGTSTTEDAKKYFSDLGKHLKPFEACDESSRHLIDMAFNKKKADDRKEWLRGFTSGTFMNHDVDEINISDFINKELILFSMADNTRSIPCSVDGFKPGQRKILFSCFKRNLKSEIKVAQLAGYVSEHSAYHHGEVSLTMTIVNMAQNFVGSNNLNLLEPLGQFGTRLQGGKDAASPRYIFTNLSPLARAIFHPADDPLLNYLNDDGQSIEPEWYIPVVPMLLINGGEGIGTGWSTAIPNYNPIDIVNNLKRLMDNQDMEPMHPWYRGFEGSIVQEGTNKYRVSGIITKTGPTTVEISELPIRSWTQAYKETLEGWVTGTEKTPAWIKDYKEYHTDSKVHFVINLSEENMAIAEAEGLESKFKVSTTISTSNLVCHDLEGRIKKYGSVLEIISDFYNLRQKFYHKRKENLLADLTAEHLKCENRVRFVLEIIDGKLIVQNRKKAELLAELKAKKYDPIFRKGANAPEDDEDNTSSHGYDYLLSMPIWNLTMEKVQALIKEQEQKEQEIKILLGQTPLDLWRIDLDAFVAQWKSFESDMEIMESQRPNNSTQAGGRKKTVKKGVNQMLKKKIDVSDEDDDDFEPVKKKAVKKVKEEPKVKEEATTKKLAKVKREDEDDDNPRPSSRSDDEFSPPKKKAKKEVTATKAKPKKAAAKESFSDDEKVAVKKEVKKPAKAKGKKAADTDDSASDFEEVKKKPAAKKQKNFDEFFKIESKSDAAPKMRQLGSRKVGIGATSKLMRNDSEETLKKEVVISDSDERLPLKKEITLDSEDEQPKKAAKTRKAANDKPKKAAKVVKVESESDEPIAVDTPPKKETKSRAKAKKRSYDESDFDDDESASDDYVPTPKVRSQRDRKPSKFVISDDDFE